MRRETLVVERVSSLHSAMNYPMSGTAQHGQELLFTLQVDHLPAAVVTASEFTRRDTR